MDITMAIVIATVFCALIVSLFMVAYRYNAMSREMKNIGVILKKQIKAEASFHSQLMEQMDHGVKLPEGEGAATPPTGGLSLNPVLLKLDALATRVEELTALLNEQLDQAAASDTSATIPPQKTPPPVQLKPTDEEPEEPLKTEVETTAQPEMDESEKGPVKEPEEGRYDDKTAVRCPACSRQLPYDALRIQDEQVCPYCQEVFRSNSYLLALITERSGKRPIGTPPENA
ncbi:MAG: hypothetical protein PHG65_08760 [Kiritimatiellae bacterium]|nr:hypothetical protein [Kiritimatiellia bacterium]